MRASAQLPTTPQRDRRRPITPDPPEPKDPPAPDHRARPSPTDSPDRGSVLERTLPDLGPSSAATSQHWTVRPRAVHRRTAHGIAPPASATHLRLLAPAPVGRRRGTHPSVGRPRRRLDPIGPDRRAAAPTHRPRSGPRRPGRRGAGRLRRRLRRPGVDRRRDRLEPADAGRHQPHRPLHEAAPRHRRALRVPAGERGARQDHRLGRLRRRRVRRRDDLQLRDAAVGRQRLAHRPRAVHRGDRRLPARGLHPHHQGRPDRGRRHAFGALLRRERVPRVPPGPLRRSRARDARTPQLGRAAGVRRSPPRSRRRHDRHRAARTGRAGARTSPR